MRGGTCHSLAGCYAALRRVRCGGELDEREASSTRPSNCAWGLPTVPTPPHWQPAQSHPRSAGPRKHATGAPRAPAHVRAAQHEQLCDEGQHARRRDGASVVRGKRRPLPLARHDGHCLLSRGNGVRVSADRRPLARWQRGLRGVRPQGTQRMACRPQQRGEDADRLPSWHTRRRVGGDQPATTYARIVRAVRRVAARTAAVDDPTKRPVAAGAQATVGLYRADW